MKYFVKNDECLGTIYHEFFMGEWDEQTFWSDSSLYLHDDIRIKLELNERVFSKVFDSYNDWGDNRVTKPDWERICEISEDCGGEIKKLFDELKPWAEDNFSKYEEFWILGI